MTLKSPICLEPIKVFRDMADLSYFRKLFRSDFVQKVAETLITRVVLIGLGIVSSVIVARILGPEGRGLYAIAISLGGLGVQFGNLGLHASNTYYVAKKPDLLPTLISNSIVVSFLIGGLGSMLFWGALSVWPFLVKIEGVLLALTLVSIPFGLIYLLLQNLLIGTQEIRSFNKIEIGNRLASLILVSGIILVQKVSVETLFLTHLSALFMSSVWVLVQLKNHSHLFPRPSFTVFENNLQYGFRAYVAALFAFLVLRSDLLLLQYMLGAEQVGLYAVAVSVADLALLAPTVIGTLIFPRLAAMDNDWDRWHYANKVAWNVGGMTGAIALLLFPTAHILIVLLYGSRFAPAAPALLWLLPGIVMLSINVIYMNYFASIGMPMITLYSPGIAAVLNIGINVKLIPVYGIIGSSIASTVTYGVMLLFSFSYVYLKKPGVRCP